jgi:hypothetical protein
VHQLTGEHRFEAYDLDRINMPGVLDAITSVDVNWFYSDARASTNVPNATSVQGTNLLNPATNAVLLTQVNTGSSAQFSFLDLEDTVESMGYQVDAQFDLGFTNGTVSGGYNRSRKAREYYGYTANIVMGAFARDGVPSAVFSDQNLQDLNNGFFMNMGSNFGTESYIAGETKAAAFGSVDAYFMDNWRATAGVRWEDFSRGVMPLNLLDYTGDSLRAVIAQMNQPGSELCPA